ncbi:thymidylate kinase [Moesziomyces antarcticus]|uniref:Thymidylate kinase n=2 Tax=Pseudozyma antarctica TaxID=84753 RepID=A0A081CDN1_PSEA2|nr:thymidylate kinase [Moesziomyces antarcticus]GAK64777.1 thymidylate kinase [Moesziomyces antarcticus]SPO45769.1 related to thymidylate kinase [Moesziomyces antarcticus]
MSALRTTSAHAAAAAAATNPEPERSPRRKMSTDLMRIKNFPSSLSLRKPADPDTPPRSDPAASTGTGTGTFSRLRALGQSQASDGKSSRRTSRLFDAFKSSKKPPPSFEVVRKPPNRSTTSFHSSLQSSTQDAVYRSQSRISTQDSPQVLEAPPRISLSAPTPDPSMPSFAAPTSPSVPNNLGSRSHYPPSTTRTRRLSSNLAATTTNNTRRTSDPHNISRTHSPAPSANVDAPTSGTFSLHSFRNVRSASDVSHTDDPSASAPSAGAHSRVHSIISVDEYVTPGEELPEPRFVDEPSSRAKSPDINRAHSTSPVANAKPASISAAKFRQAARQRSESGTIPTLDNIHAGRPPRSRTPSQDLAAMEAVLAQTNQRAVRPVDPDRRRSTGPTTVSSPVLAPAAEDHQHRRKRGFFIVVEGLDRAGKSTQVERLAQHLNAKPIKFPERTTAIGQMINSYLAQTSELDDQAIHLLFSANRWECVAAIHKTLDAGESIVCDRYAFSGIAYSVSKGLSYDWCRHPDIGLPLPDLTLFLDLDAQTAAARGGYGEERYEKLEFQAKVREAFSRVAQDVKAHGGRWVTIDAGKTLDQVTDDIQRAVQRATSSIDRVGIKLGRLFVSERPAVERGGSSGELVPPAVLPSVKRASMSSDELGRRGKSLDQPGIHVDTATTNGTFPAARPSGSPLSYTEQLSAVRAAAAGTLSGLFGGSNSALDQQNAGGSGDRGVGEEGPSPANGLRGQGFDSARVLGKHVDASGRRRTLIDVIGEIENAPSPAWGEHRRSVSAAEAPAGVSGGSVVPPPRVRRSTDQGRGGQLAPDAASRGALADHALPSPTSPTAVSPALRAASPMTSSSRSSMASPVARPASTSPAVDATVGAEGQLSAQHLSQLNVQQGQAEMHEQYMRNYMAMMANPMLAHQAHYLAMQRQQQQYYGRAASVGVGGSHLGAGANGNSAQGGAPLAAFMQPSVQNPGAARRAHSRTPSTSELDTNAPMGQGQGGQGGQPMLSMMMAPPPAPANTTSAGASMAQYAYPMYAQQPFYAPPGFGWGGGYASRPGYATTRSEIATPSSARLRSQKSDQAIRPQ